MRWLIKVIIKVINSMNVLSTDAVENSILKRSIDFQITFLAFLKKF